MLLFDCEVELALFDEDGRRLVITDGLRTDPGADKLWIPLDTIARCMEEAEAAGQWGRARRQTWNVEA